METIFYIIKNGSSVTRVDLVACGSAVWKPLPAQKTPNLLHPG